MSENKYNEEFRLIYNGGFLASDNIYVTRADLEEIGLIPVDNTPPKKRVVFRFDSVVNKQEVHSIYIDNIVNEELDQKQTESLLRKLHAGIFKMYDISESDLEKLVKNVYEGVVRK
jgi:hypothetical protein